MGDGGGETGGDRSGVLICGDKGKTVDSTCKTS